MYLVDLYCVVVVGGQGVVLRYFDIVLVQGFGVVGLFVGCEYIEVGIVVVGD